VSGLLATFSLGAVTQTIALAALDYGLGTCIQGAPVFYPQVVRQIAGIPESTKLVMAIAIGYPDWDFPANKLHTTRQHSCLAGSVTRTPSPLPRRGG